MAASLEERTAAQGGVEEHAALVVRYEAGSRFVGASGPRVILDASYLEVKDQSYSQ
jgi:hypothetical protein